MTEARPRTWTHVAKDGYSLRIERHDPQEPPWARMVILHGIQSHAGWYRGLGQRLAAMGIEAHLPDRRGSGEHTRKRGHARTSGQLLEDLAGQLRAIRAENPEIPVALAGISWGAKLALTTAASHPELAESLILITPGFHPSVDVSRSAYVTITACFLLQIPARFRIPLDDPSLFTASPSWQEFIANDPQSLRRGSAGLLASSIRLDHRSHLAWPKVAQPTLMLLAGQDRIMDNARTRKSFERIGTADRTVIEYPGAHHTLEFEPDPDRYANDMAEWLKARVRTSGAGPCPTGGRPAAVAAGSGIHPA